MQELAVFGSAVRGDFRPDSDIDLLVAFEPDANWGLFEQVAMEAKLAQASFLTDLKTQAAVLHELLVCSARRRSAFPSASATSALNVALTSARRTP